jgi:hypothetical protein
MTVRTVVYLVLAALAVAVMLANWTIMSTSVDLSLFVATVRVPIYLLLVLAAGLVLVLDALVEAQQRHRWALERRQLLAERDQARLELANEETSRFGTLRTGLQGELSNIRTDLDRLVEGQRVLLDELPAMRELDAHGNRRLPV